MAGLTIKQAARKIGVRADDIRRAIELGSLKSSKSVRRGEVIDEDDLIWWADKREEGLAILRAEQERLLNEAEADFAHYIEHGAPF